MKIWKLRIEVDEYDSLVPLKAWSWERIHTFDGRSQINTWSPIEVTRLEPEKKLKLSDAPGFYSHIPIFGEKAKKFLEYVCGGAVEFLPLINEEKIFWIVNIVRVLDCIEYEKSEYKKFPNSRKVMRFKKYYFKPEIISNEHIFKIKDMPLSAPFVSDEFKKVVEENNLTGFKFELVWDSEED